MAMAGPSGMNTDALLRLTQWLSPSFPTSAYAYSGGLEWAMATGEVDGGTLADWIAATLAFGTGWGDAVLLAMALRPGADHAVLDDLGQALCLTSERLTETLDQGTAFGATVAALGGTAGRPAILPVAVGRAAASLGLPPALVIALYLHAVAGNLISAAVRFLPLGQTHGQRLLAGLHDHITAIAARAATADESDLGTAALRADMIAAWHETQAVRIFRT